MAAFLKLVQNDTAPAVVVSLTNAQTGQPINVATASALKMFFMAAGSTTLLDTLTGTAQPGLLNPDGTITMTGYTNPGSGGLISFAWNPTTLQVSPGEYWGSVQITFADGTKQTVPAYVRFSVRSAP